jgi:hypothetical protein
MTVFDVEASHGNQTRLIRIFTGRKMAVLVEDRNSVIWMRPEILIAGFQHLEFHELTRDMIRGADISPLGHHLYINFVYGGMHQTFVLESIPELQCRGL